MKLYADLFRSKCVEPQKRTHGNGPQWMSHRFEIKGGISWRDAMITDLSAPNLLLDIAAVKKMATDKNVKPSHRFPPVKPR